MPMQHLVTFDDYLRGEVANAKSVSMSPVTFGQ